MKANFEEFKNTLTEALLDKGLKTKATSIKKPGVEYAGLVIDANGISPVVNLSDLFKEYEQVTEELVKKVYSILMDNQKEKCFANSPYDLWHWDYVKDKLFLSVIGAEVNAEYLADKVYSIQEDIAVLPRVFVGNSTEGTASAPVTKALAKHWGVSEEELMAAAIKASEKKFPAKLINMEEEFGIPMDVPFTPLTTVGKTYGAAALFYSGMMSKLFDKYGTFYVLPSSVHEVLILPDDSMSKEELKSLVEAVNADGYAMPNKSDILTGSVYKYDGLSFKKVA